MRRRKRWHRILAWLLTKGLAVYLKTLRLEILGKERTEETLVSSTTGCVFLLWHDSILLSPLLQWVTAVQPLCLLISNSRDGDIPSEIGMQYPGITVLRVKHTDRAGALLTSCAMLDERRSLFITPDGPRGPRHKIKQGALYACQKSRAPIIPIVYAASSQKTVSSWDRFKIPYPFSRVLFSFLEPVSCTATDDLETVKTAIEQKMEEEEKRLQTQVATYLAR